MRAELRAGIAIYNAGEYHAAHDAWEDRWLTLDRGTDDERLLHGLIQFTAAIHHAHDRNWDGATGLADSARRYLAELPEGYRGVDLRPVRAVLGRLAADPAWIERASVPAITHEGMELVLDDLAFETGAVAAGAIAGDRDRFDERVLERAIAYARRDLDAGEETSPFVTLVLDFARDRDHRDIAYRRLAGHADRRESRERDVEGLFDP